MLSLCSTELPHRGEPRRRLRGGASALQRDLNARVSVADFGVAQSVEGQEQHHQGIDWDWLSQMEPFS